MKRWHYPAWFRLVLGIIAVGLFVAGLRLYAALIDFDIAAQYRAAHASALAGLNEVPDEHADLLNEGWRQLPSSPSPMPNGPTPPTGSRRTARSSPTSPGCRTA